MRLTKIAAPLPTKLSLSLGLSPVISVISSLRLIRVEWHWRQIRQAVDQASRPLLLARKNTTLTALAGWGATIILAGRPS